MNLHNIIRANLYILEREEWLIREKQTDMLFKYEEGDDSTLKSIEWNCLEFLLKANSVLVKTNNFFRKHI